MQRNSWFGTAAVLAMLAAPIGARAQLATIYGSLGNFDVVNDTGHDAHGFEIQLEGLTGADVYYSFSAERFTSPFSVAITR